MPVSAAAICWRAARRCVWQLLTANLTLFFFNLIPAFPMDGGRVLRAILSHLRSARSEATRIAARVGQGMALLFALWRSVCRR